MAAPRERGGWIVRVGERSTTISPDRDSVYSFDLEGRPLSWFEHGRVYKRSLSSEVHLRERIRGSRRHSTLEPGQAAGAFARILDRVSRTPVEAGEPCGTDRLADILRWRPETLLRERERFAATYRPVNILPPDQYLSIVLQATFGCSWNRCTFCSFYSDQPFRTRSAKAFEAHCRAVRELLGRGAALRRQIFLASGNALMLDDRRLVPLLRTAQAVFPGRAISGFVDLFGGLRKSVENWTMLREHGLERVHVGLETGDDALLAWLNKPGQQVESLRFVSALKRARLKVALILMVGVGGRRFAESHSRRTLSLLERLPLQRGDTVYLSPFVEQPGSAYARRAATEGVLPLDAAESEHQYVELRDGIRRSIPGVTVARYDLREFVY